MRRVLKAVALDRIRATSRRSRTRARSRRRGPPSRSSGRASTRRDRVVGRLGGGRGRLRRCLRHAARPRAAGRGVLRRRAGARPGSRCSMARAAGRGDLAADGDGHWTDFDEGDRAGAGGRARGCPGSSLRRGWVSSTDAAWPRRSRRLPAADGATGSAGSTAGGGHRDRRARATAPPRSCAGSSTGRAWPTSSITCLSVDAVRRVQAGSAVYALARVRDGVARRADRLRHRQWLGCRGRRRLGLPVAWLRREALAGDAVRGRRAAPDRDDWPGVPSIFVAGSDRPPRPGADRPFATIRRDVPTSWSSP